MTDLEHLQALLKQYPTLRLSRALEKLAERKTRENLRDEMKRAAEARKKRLFGYWWNSYIRDLT